MRRLTKEEVSSILLDYYRGIDCNKDFTSPFKADSIFNPSNGLGDSLILSPFIRDKKINNGLLEDLNGHVPFCQGERFSKEFELDISEIARYNWGGGHCIQRIQRGLGLPIQHLPRPALERAKNHFKGYVFVHLATNTDWKRNTPNSLGAGEQETIRNFFSINSHLTPYYFKNDLPLPLLYHVMSKCEYFLGIDSGPMHLAAGLGLKSIIVINNPGNSIYLPRIKECDIPNSEWLYPQHVHLNTMLENPLVPSFSDANLDRAFKGEVYPYFSEEFLDLYSVNNLDYPAGNSNAAL